jgi:broad specificity phosphatase PhoE
MRSVEADLPWHTVRDRGDLAVVLVRHGRTELNRQRRFVGRTDVPLDDEGHAQAARLGAVVRGQLTALYSSRLERARQTAEALAPPAPVLLAGVEEVDQGQLEGLEVDEALRRWPAFFTEWDRDPERTRVPGGETLGEARDRALEAIVGLVERHDRGEAIGVVAHQLVIASLVCTLEGDPLSAWREYGLPNTGIAVLAWNGRALRVIARRWSPAAGGSPRSDV